MVQQLREAFAYESIPKFLIFDHDAKYGFEVPAAVRSMSLASVRNCLHSPWQSGIAERWVGSCRRDLLDPIIAINPRPRKRLLSAYIAYYHEDRTHLGLGKETPLHSSRSASTGHVVSHRRLGACTTVTTAPPEIGKLQ